MDIIKYTQTTDLLTDAKQIIETTKQYAFRSINLAMLQRNWLLGKRISDEILKGENRAEYGAEVIQKLSKELTAIYGKGFGKNNLYRYVQFYKFFSTIFPTPLGKSELLTWSHYILLVTIDNKDARNWYAHEAYTENWSVRTLKRNIDSQYYFRLLQSQNKDAMQSEMKSLTAKTQNDKLEFIKNPIVAEFLWLAPNTSEDIAKYSVLSESNQIFQAKYLTYLPTEEELRNEIERQKEIFMLQQETEK